MRIGAAHRYDNALATAIALLVVAVTIGLSTKQRGGIIFDDAGSSSRILGITTPLATAMGGSFGGHLGAPVSRRGDPVLAPGPRGRRGVIAPAVWFCAETAQKRLFVS